LKCEVKNEPNFRSGVDPEIGLPEGDCAKQSQFGPGAGEGQVLYPEGVMVNWAYQGLRKTNPIQGNRPARPGAGGPNKADSGVGPGGGPGEQTPRELAVQSRSERLGSAPGTPGSAGNALRRHYERGERAKQSQFRGGAGRRGEIGVAQRRAAMPAECPSGDFGLLLEMGDL
jgi:hypothetical protein